MEQHTERSMREELDRTPAADLVPGFDAGKEWEQLSARLPRSPRRRVLPILARVAAAALLVATGWTIWRYTQSGSGAKETIAAADTGAQQGWVQTYLPDTETLSANAQGPERPASPVAVTGTKKTATTAKTGAIAANTTIHNNTPCPIELLINQELKCPNAHPKPVTCSSMVQPDQAAPLHYADDNTVAKNCSLTVKEIEIRSIATGEVILLNDNSAPYTAQEVFCYLTREKQGDILAGVFHRDCEKRNRRHSLRLDNRDGRLTLQ